MDKVLIVVRHAHRDVLHASDDNGLSEKGRLQARAIRDFYKKEFENKAIELFSSPRIRCQETLEPLANFLKVEVQISALLDESAQTKMGRIDQRIQKFIEWWKNEASERILICSHGDWIPLFFEKLLGSPLELKKAGWAEVSLRNKKFAVERLIQKWL